MAPDPGFVDSLAAILAELRRERSLPAAHRDTTASDAALDTAVREVERAVESLSDSRNQDALTALARAAVPARHSWSYASPTTEALVTAEQHLRRTVEADYARTWAGATGPTPRPTPPTRTRFAKLALLVAMTIAAVTVVVVLNVMGLLPLAGPYVALALAPTVVILGIVWSTRRTSRWRDHAIRELRALAPLIRQERATPPTARPSGASDESLRLASATVEDALRKFAHHGETEALPTLDELRDLATDWHPESPLALGATRLTRTAKRLTAVTRRTDRLTDTLNSRPENRRDVRAWDRWLIRFPAYSLLVALGCVGLVQNGLLQPPAAVALTGVGMLLVAAGQWWQQTRK